MKTLTTQVIIVGAGPTGLMLANQLERFDIDYIMIDKKPSTVPESRAMGVQARSVEFYYQLGIDKEMVEQGHQSKKAQLFDDSGLRLTLDFASKYTGKATPFEFLLDLEQNKSEKILLKNLDNQQNIWFDSTVAEAGDDKEKAWVVFEHQGKQYKVEGEYLAACDGAGSVVRKSYNLDFDGKRYDNDFLVMDVYGKFKDQLDGIGLTIKNDTVGLAFKLKEKDKYRLFAVVPEGEAEDKTANEAKEIMLDNFPSGFVIDKVKWHSFYHVSSRMLSKFDKGRVFFAGDSAHIHSPAGGQGMNTGLGDSVNLGWKLAYVLQKKAHPNILSTYSLERTRFAKGLLRTTDRAFSLFVNPNTFSKFSLNNVFPIIFGSISNFSFSQNLFFERISQIAINHFTSPLSYGKVGKIKGGLRLPYFQVGEGTSNSFDKMKTDKFVVFYASSKDLDPKKLDIGFDFDLVKITNQEAIMKYKLPDGAYFAVRPDMYISKCGVI